MRGRILAMCLAAGLASSVGSALGGRYELTMQGNYSEASLAPPATKRASRTHSAHSPFGYPHGPGWTVARVKRMALKARNQRRNRLAHRRAK